MSFEETTDDQLWEIAYTLALDNAKRQQVMLWLTWVDIPVHCWYYGVRKMHVEVGLL